MEWFDTTLIGFIAGTLGTGLGGILSFFILKPSNKALGTMLGVAAGIMLSVVFMELLAEATNTSYPWTILGLLAGIIAFLFLDNFFPHTHFVTEEVRTGRFLKKGILIATGIALHNISEGIAIGAGFAASTGMGITLAVLISLHNVPEGLAVAIPLNIGGMGRARVFGSHCWPVCQWDSAHCWERQRAISPPDFLLYPWASPPEPCFISSSTN